MMVPARVIARRHTACGVGALLSVGQEQKLIQATSHCRRLVKLKLVAVREARNSGAAERLRLGGMEHRQNHLHRIRVHLLRTAFEGNTGTYLRFCQLPTSSFISSVACLHLTHGSRGLCHNMASWISSQLLFPHSLLLQILFPTLNSGEGIWMAWLHTRAWKESCPLWMVVLTQEPTCAHKGMRNVELTNYRLGPIR